jgi:hypothetical protein
MVQGHPASRRCSSLTNSRFARSSRLAIRAPRFGSYVTNHAAWTLDLASLRERRDVLAGAERKGGNRLGRLSP